METCRLPAVTSQLNCSASHFSEHRTVRGLWKKRQGISCFCKIPTLQQSQKKEMHFIYVTLVTHVALAIALYSPCLFEYVTIGLVHHNRTHVSRSERLLKCQHNAISISEMQFQLYCWHLPCTNVMVRHYWAILVERGSGQQMSSIRPTHSCGLWLI